MFLALDRKAFEAALIEVAIADRAVRHAPAHGVGVRQPAEEIGHLGVGRRPHDEMPVVAHHAPGKNWERDAFVGLDHYPFKSGEVRVPAKHGHAARRPVEDVVDVAFWSYS